MFKHGEKLESHHGWLKLVLIIIPIVLTFVGVSLFAVNNWYYDNLEPLASEITEDVVVVIEAGSSVREIGDQLKDLGVIRNSTVFSWYVGRQDNVHLQAGTYRLNPAQSVKVIVDKIATGDVATNLYTIIPGLRVDQLLEDFIEFGFPEEEVIAAINARYDDHPLFKDFPANATLEGYIFPETYEVNVDDTVADILQKSFDQFDSQITDELRSKLKKLGLNMHEAVTLASIIEKESVNIEDQSKIAQVFLSRLEQDIMLGSDVTFFYAAAVTGEKPSPDLDHPYNTRIYGGLPPGPIGNFNFSAFESLANPSNTDYLFFVAGDDGKTYFSKTVAEHNALTNEYCIELCKLPE